ncbi:MAG: Gfo/Idh/MocA family oxidoreductase [Candidatus Omnitrophica bacterium]|nr:scyllo-inositol 2-dehydrogenase (NAD(+)) [bacterium]NUN97874.1 Gfo/Idh/MocA family oxidoreductase [Candidatus Omnitrophota bacterium]
MGKDAVKIAFVGCGGIHWPHLHGYLEIPEKARVVACCDVHKPFAQASAEKAGGAKVYTDWRKMLDSEEIDAVDICLPHHLHHPCILDSAKRKKHILCEKPLCLNLKEAREIKAAVRKAGVTFMSAHNQLFDPIIQRAKRMVDEGLIGKVFYLRTQDCFYLDRLANEGRKGMGWRGDVQKQGGGELIDTGYHPSYLLLYLAGARAVEVHAVLGNFLGALQAEDTAAVSVAFENGAIGQILTSWAFQNPMGAHQIHFIGSKGQLYGSHKDLYFLPSGFSAPAHIHVEGPNAFRTEVEHFADCIRERRKPLPDLQQAVDVLELILKATKKVR